MKSPHTTLSCVVLGAIVCASLGLSPSRVHATICGDVECGDLDGNGTLSATDALRLLRRAIGVDLELMCPLRCVGPSSTTTTTTTTTTSTTTTTTVPPTTTTLPGLQLCTVIFRLTDFVDVHGISLDIDYSGFAGELPGEGRSASCTGLLGEEGLATFADDDALGRLSVNVVASSFGLGQIGGPHDLIACDFLGTTARSEDFSIDVVDAVRAASEIRSGGSGVCGSPETGLERPTVRDMFAVAWSMDAISQRQCPLCECDLDGSGAIGPTDYNAADAAALNLPGPLLCPTCAYEPEVRGTGEPVSVVVAGIGCEPAGTTTTLSTPTTTLADVVCAVTIGVADSDLFRAVQYEVDYGGAGGDFVGSGFTPELGGTLACSNLYPGTTSELGMRDDATVERLSGYTLDANGFSGPVDLARCFFTPSGSEPAADDFVVSTIAAVNSGSVFEGGSNVCGSPVTGYSRPTVEDYYFALLAGVSSFFCDPCECDVNASGSINATDALLVQEAILDDQVVFECPGTCPGQPTVIGANDTADVRVTDVDCQ